MTTIQETKKITLYADEKSFHGLTRNYAFILGLCPDCMEKLEVKIIDGEKRRVCSKCGGVVYVEEKK